MLATYNYAKERILTVWSYFWTTEWALDRIWIEKGKISKRQTLHSSPTYQYKDGSIPVLKVSRIMPQNNLLLTKLLSMISNTPSFDGRSRIVTHSISSRLSCDIKTCFVCIRQSNRFNSIQRELTSLAIISKLYIIWISAF